MSEDAQGQFLGILSLDQENKEEKRANILKTELDFFLVLGDLDLAQHLTAKHWAVASFRLAAYSGMDMLLFAIEDLEDANQSSADEA